MSAATMTETGPAVDDGGPGPLVFTYERKSPYANDGKGSSLGVDAQFRTIEAYVRDRIHPAARIVRFTDEGKSGYALDKPRPAWEAALSGVAKGEPFALVAWHSDRMGRRVENAGRLWGLIERTGVQLHTTFGGHVTDPMTFYFESIMAENESRQRSRRLRLKHETLSIEGRFSGGQRRYGYTADMGAIVEPEAEVIREIAGRVLNGESLGSVARSLNARYIPTARGYVLDPETGAPTPERYLWHQSSVRQMLVSPHLSGRRKRDGEYVPARWARVLEIPFHDALIARLTEPARTSVKSPARRYLLTGIARCGKCNAPVRGTAIRSLDATVYRCRECKGFQRAMAPTDAMVREYVVARLSEMDASGALVSDAANREAAALAAEREGLAGERRALAELLAARTLTATGYAAAEAALVAREAAIDERLRFLADDAADPIHALEGATGPEAGRVWDGWTNDPTGAGLARQRAIVALLLDVVIHPIAVHGRKTFDPESVSITYRPLG